MGCSESVQSTPVGDGTKNQKQNDRTKKYLQQNGNIQSTSQHSNQNMGSQYRPQALSKYLTVLMGITKKGPTIMTVQRDNKGSSNNNNTSSPPSLKINTKRIKYQFPRYAQALIITGNSNTSSASQQSSIAFGILTGGIEQLQVNINNKATIDFQILEGTISKKCIQVHLPTLLMTGDNKKDKSNSSIGVNENTADDAFELLADMNQRRYAHCCIQLNGKLYVMGGRQYGGENDSLLKDCECFKLFDDEAKWTAVPSLNHPRSEAVAILYKSHIYIFGGCMNYTTRTKTIESFCQGDKEWRVVPYELPQGLENPTVMKNPEKQSLIVFGGKTDFGGRSNRVFEWDLNKSIVMHRKQMLDTRSAHKMFKSSTKGGLFDNNVGGSSTQTEDQNEIMLLGGGTQTTEIYNLSDQEQNYLYDDINYLQFCTLKEMNSFSQLQQQITLMARKTTHQTPQFPHKVYIFGHSHQPFTKILDCEKFVVANDGQHLSHSFNQFTNTIKVNKQHCFVLGGIDSTFSEVSSKAYSFNLLNEEIKPLQNMTHERYGFCSIVKGSYLYVIGGRKLGNDDVAILNHCERFSFESYKWEPIASLKQKRHSAFCILAGDFIVTIGGYRGNGNRLSDIEIYIEDQNRWVELDEKFDLAIEAMTPVTYNGEIYLFGGRNESNDIQKVFKLKVQIDEGVKYERSVHLELEPVGSLSYPGTNLKVYLNEANGLCYVFGNIENGFDVYDLKKNKIVQREQLVVFEKLKDKKFQSYTMIF